MDHEVEYSDAMIKMLELIWGEGFMAPGGPDLADRLVADLDLAGKRVLDIGSGLGGPCCHLAQKHGAIVTGVDIEPQLIEISNRRARQKELAGRAEFKLVEPGPLPFADDSFEVEELSYALELPGAYESYLQDAGFSDISVADDSGWYRRQSREEYELLKGPLYQQMVDLLGKADADHFVEDWRAMAIVFEKGDLTQTICRSARPD